MAHSEGGSSSAASAPGEKKGALVNDFTVRGCVLDAMREGLPKATAKKWVHDLSRNFYVQDDASFTKAWYELRQNWEKQSTRKQRKQRRQQDTQEPSAKRVKTQSDLQTVLDCLKAAQEDLQQGVCESLEKAAAVHLSISLGSNAAAVLAALGPRGDCQKMPGQDHAHVRAGLASGPGARGYAVMEKWGGQYGAEEPGALQGTGPSHRGSQARLEDLPTSPGALRTLLNNAGPPMALKQLTLLVHPDKTQHPRAKEAFQRLAPELRAKMAEL
ncbi:unnamed protein product [Effrenium voratum]|uniref:Uncharacterized protein n=1 Tax=Effrenium voratum TaxID=2562239 RepID=A0AA36MZY2_9DINO|nr:unnamed protein product [Effrenium voratum]